MIKSDSIKELATALAKAQGEMSNPLFDSVNPHFKSRYASLAAVRNAVIPVLAKYGLSIMQSLTTTETGVKCGVVVMHGSGELIQFDPMEVPATKMDAQGVVSAATYAKRTTLQSVFCVVGDGDDDGNAATGRTAAPPSDDRPPVTLDDAIVKALDDAKTLDELKAAWTAIPVGSRHAYTEKKNEAKDRIAAAGKAA